MIHRCGSESEPVCVVSGQDREMVSEYDSEMGSE